jgi:hypothetical protein
MVGENRAASLWFTTAIAHCKDSALSGVVNRDNRRHFENPQYRPMLIYTRERTSARLLFVVAQVRIADAAREAMATSFV